MPDTIRGPARARPVFLSILLALGGGFSVAVNAASLLEQGVDGAAGADGTATLPGEPATDGEPGGPGGSANAVLTTSTDIANGATALGGHGGKGGDGGFGVADAAGFAFPGNGGNGGLGGSAVAEVETRTTGNAAGATGRDALATARAVGGNGGDGGIGGERSSTASPGVSTRGADGRGANGGNATASARGSTEQDNLRIEVRATGGTGGSINPSNRTNPDTSPAGPSIAGGGGQASIQAFGQSTAGGTVAILGEARGGNGGSVTNATHANVSVGQGVSVDLVNAVDGTTSGLLNLTQRAFGGNAGSITGVNGRGAGAAGGDANSVLEKTTDSASLALSTQATGGQGSSNRLFHGFTSAASSSVNGMRGGNATATSNAINTGGQASAQAEAIGGTGGDAGASTVRADGTSVNTTAIAGDGGNASAVAHAEATGGGATARAIQTGGRGGTTNVGSVPTSGVFRAGRGADSVMIDAVSGSSDVALFLEQVATGGAGGDGLWRSDASAGQGGNGISRLTATNPGGGNLNGSSVAIGGNSGNEGIAATGGTATAALSLTGSGDVSGIASAQGGRGSSQLVDAGLNLPAGDGGRARIESVWGESTGGGRVALTADAQGGHGGDARQGGAGGNGASVSLVDVVDGTTTGELVLSQTARGGNAGFTLRRLAGSTRANAGNAFSSLTRSTNTASNLVLSSEARGGFGPATTLENRPYTAGEASPGGRATAIANGSSSSGGLEVLSTAWGGGGGTGSASISEGGRAGRGGDARASSTSLATAIALPDAALVSDASATGGTGGSISNFNGGPNFSSGGDGGNALSEAQGTLRGNNAIRLARASAGAWGGAGGFTDAPSSGTAGRGGDARATARLTIDGALPGETLSSARAFGGDGGGNNAGLGGRGGNARADASLTGAVSSIVNPPGSGIGGEFPGEGPIGPDPTPRVEASAVAGIGRNGAPNGRASATATLLASNGIAQANARSGNLDSQVIITSTAVQESLRVEAVAGGFSGAPVTSGELAGTAQARLSSGIGSLASTATLDRLGTVRLGGAYAGTSAGTSQLTDASVRVSLDPAALGTPDILGLALFAPSLSGNGFDSLRLTVIADGRNLLDRQFTDALAALDYFNNNSLDLGNWADFVSGGPTSNLDLEFILALNTGAPGDGFVFNLAFGNGPVVVPLPAAVWLFLSGLTGLLMGARPGWRRI
ncbi:MAG TPA: hypothetical protein ENJ79_09895 [Gammaproteobacteria bacterium]|nr:hypothetical protein [Gammaproteobacteria bacterium]